MYLVLDFVSYGPLFVVLSFMLFRFCSDGKVYDISRKAMCLRSISFISRSLREPMTLFVFMNTYQTWIFALMFGCLYAAVTFYYKTEQYQWDKNIDSRKLFKIFAIPTAISLLQCYWYPNWLCTFGYFFEALAVLPDFEFAANAGRVDRRFYLFIYAVIYYKITLIVRSMLYENTKNVPLVLSGMLQIWLYERLMKYDEELRNPKPRMQAKQKQKQKQKQKTVPEKRNEGLLGISWDCSDWLYSYLRRL